MRIGFIGLGAMGTAMAANLSKAGMDVTVYNRTRERAEPLEAAGAKVADRATDAVTDVVVTMLADDRAVERVLFEDGVLAAMPRAAVHVSMSTISVALAERLTQAHADQGSMFVSAPVFGRPQAAAAAELFIVAAGPPTVIESLDAVFRALGRRTYVVGEAPSAANVVKLAGNFLIASVIESLGEAFALVRKAGVDQAAFHEVITTSLFSSPVYQVYAGIISRQKYRPAGFKLPLGLKDVGLVLAAAQQFETPMPVASIIRDHFLAAIARGDGDADWAALAKLSAENAGLREPA